VKLSCTLSQLTKHAFSKVDVSQVVMHEQQQHAGCRLQTGVAVHLGCRVCTYILHAYTLRYTKAGSITRTLSFLQPYASRTSATSIAHPVWHCGATTFTVLNFHVAIGFSSNFKSDTC
jgi:hypothetical protein